MVGAECPAEAVANSHVLEQSLPLLNIFNRADRHSLRM